MVGTTFAPLARSRSRGAATDFPSATFGLLKGPNLAEQGRAKVEVAGERMPVLRLVREDFQRRRPLAGVRIAACLHVTTETANFAGR